MTDSALLDRFAAIVGDQNALRDPTDIDPYLQDPRGLFHGTAPVVLRPANAEEVSQILALATETGTSIVPQAGNTGHTGGQVPLDGQSQVIVSVSRLNRIRDVDLDGNTMTVEAGCILANVQQAAHDANRLFPLSLGSEGSCEIGGNLGSNAGGTAVLAYGNMRHLCLGLEVVLPTGEIWNGLRSLKKDNTGYDLRDLFIGAEGTLGIITAAVLKLFPRPPVNAPPAQAGGFRVRLKAIRSAIRRTARSANTKIIIRLRGFWAFMYSIHISSVTLPLVQTQ